MGWCVATDAFDAEVVHVHTSCFLIVGKDKALLYDTSIPVNWPVLDRQLDSVLGDRPLDWIVPSHAEIAHAGNLGRLLRKYPHAIVAGDSRDFHMYFPAVVGRVDSRGPGTRLDLGGGYHFTILPAPIKDAPNTVWGVEESQRVLFTADAFSYSHHPTVAGIADEESDFAVHTPGECTLMASELGGPPSPKQAGFITKAALYWTRYVEIAPFFAEIEEMFKKYSIRMVAPAHGGVIDDIDAIMPVIREAHRLAYQEVLPANRSTA